MCGCLFRLIFLIKLRLISIRTHDQTCCPGWMPSVHRWHPAIPLYLNITVRQSRQSGVDTYLPARENMALYQDAVKLAASNGNWQKHPNRKRKYQKIQLVTDLGPLWENSGSKEDVPICFLIFICYHSLDSQGFRIE